jgi:threonine/homoserine/homoserine lactone efflux protein
MDSTLLGSMTGFAFVSAITPGPNNLLLMSSGALFGRRQTLPLLAGVLVGFTILLTSAVLGLGSVVTQWPGVVTVVRIVGASWLGWMALGFVLAGLRRPTTSTKAPATPISRALRFHEGVLLQWVNPKAILLVVTAGSAYIEISEPLFERLAIIVAVFFLAGAVCCSLWMTAGAALNRFMSSGTSARYLNMGMGVLILLTALHILIG